VTTVCLLSVRGRVCVSDGYFIDPQARWSDDLRRTAGKSLMRVAEDRARWRKVGETYVQQWTAVVIMVEKNKYFSTFSFVMKLVFSPVVRANLIGRVADL
jgi:hypothetical protein